MRKSHFTVVAAGGGASSYYFTYSLVLQSGGFQPGVWTPPKGHQINLRGHEMINGRGKKKKQTSDTQTCIHLLDSSLPFFKQNIGSFYLLVQLFNNYLNETM